MPNKFLYIDDNQRSLSEGNIRALNETQIVAVEFYEALSWNHIVDCLISNSGQYDGLLIDWKLGITFGHDAEVLATHIRVMVNDDLINFKDVPVVLCSANNKFREDFDKDTSSHVLFLSIYTKNEMANQAVKVATEMNSLAEAFDEVQSGENISTASLLTIPEEIKLDPRLDEEVDSLIENRSTHNLIRFILKEVVEKPGPLIDENILAARLGIDFKKSSDWSKLKDEYLSAFSYKGVLHEGWNRWWADGLENWWKSQIQIMSPQSRTAKQRVKLLIEKTGLLGLVNAEKQKLAAGTTFWTKCVITNLPLDILDGLRVIPETAHLPWQDEQFVSPFGLLNFGPEGLKSNGFRLHPFEKEKWQNLRKNNGK